MYDVVGILQSATVGQAPDGLDGVKQITGRDGARGRHDGRRSDGVVSAHRHTRCGSSFHLVMHLVMCAAARRNRVGMVEICGARSKARASAGKNSDMISWHSRRRLPAASDPTFELDLSLQPIPIDATSAIIVTSAIPCPHHVRVAGQRVTSRLVARPRRSFGELRAQKLSF